MREIKVEVHPRFKKVQAVMAIMETLTLETDSKMMQITAKPYMHGETVGYHISNDLGRQINVACSSNCGELPYLWFGDREFFNQISGNVVQGGPADFAQPDTYEEVARQAMEWLVNGVRPL